MNLDIVRLHFTSPLHIATPSEDYGKSHDMVHSDTIWSAIIHAWAVLGIDIPENPDDAGFSLSSLFPFTFLNDKSLYFFPKPFVPFNIQKKEVSDIAKKLKKIKWVDTVYFEMILNNETVTGFGKDNEHLQGDWLCGQVLNDFIKKDVVPRARVPRIAGEDTTIYYMERIYFAENSGLFFILNCKDEKAKHKIHAALNLLHSEGIGSDRNIGHGKFDWCYDTLKLGVPETSSYCTNLSLFCPKSREELIPMLDDNSRYDLIKRGGWLSDEQWKTFRKQSVYMFREGGVFAIASNGKALHETGTIVNVTPPGVNMHPVWRNGKALFIPIKIEK